ncbi:MAG: anti-sigma F factor [Eubacteriales bacterium]|jgi:stage II sporulation protein AB (anti-sigma F factor)
MSIHNRYPVNEMKLEFPSRSINEGFARAAIAGFAAQLDPTLDELNDIKTAVSEAVTNCIVHAYPEKMGTVMLRGRIYEDGVLEITVRDRGVGIEDVKKARVPMFTTGNEERSGMGFTIMESFMDKLYVRSKVGGGTTVRMIKRITPRNTVR